jgi:hypothetical protein
MKRKVIKDMSKIQKIQNGRHKQRSGKHILARKKIYKKDSILSMIAKPGSGLAMKKQTQRIN